MMLDRFEQLLNFALLAKASDIHFEIIENKFTISVRGIDGFKVFSTDNNDLKLLQYLKYKSNLNLIDEHLPQSGSFFYIYNDVEYYFRLASIKNIFIETCVIRILNKFFLDYNVFSNISSKIDQLLHLTSGMIIFSGPTGSGKTTSMYSFIQRLENKKIYCIEDPVEIFFPNLVQISVNKQQNLTYKEGIKQILRHDPDVIVIGEIRDEQAASMAIRAAITGHLVICTIHARDSFLAISRLLDLGIKKSDIIDNVVFIANQRLILKDHKTKWSVYETIDESIIYKYFKENKKLKIDSIEDIVKRHQFKS